MKCPLCEQDFDLLKEHGDIVLAKVDVEGIGVEAHIRPCITCYEKMIKAIAVHINTFIGQSGKD